MSTVYIIKDGIIVDKKITTSSYRDSRGQTFKPKTKREEQEVLRFSENNIKIKKLKEEIQALKTESDLSSAGVEYANDVDDMFKSISSLHHQKFFPGEFERMVADWKEVKERMADVDADQALAAQAVKVLREGEALRRNSILAEMKWTEHVNAAIEKIKILRERANQLEGLMFCVSTTEGTEEVNAQIDVRTNGMLERIYVELDAISDEISRNEIGEMKELMKKLDELDKNLQMLPKEAREVFTAQIWRQEQSQNVVERLTKAGWRIEELTEGDGIFDDIYIAVKNVSGDKAVITFSIEGEVRIDSFFNSGAKESRSALQQTVLGALMDGGAKNASGHCVDEKEDIKETSVNVSPIIESEENIEWMVRTEKTVGSKNVK